jgi:hypothetical protein
MLTIRRSKAIFAGMLLALAATFVPAEAGAIPAFARRFKMTCATCHAPFPRLTPFGEQFAGNGFAIPGMLPTDTIATGDPQLLLMRDIPLAVRLDAYVQAQTRARGGRVVADLQTPWLIKLLSGGEVANNISYYFYFFLGERGEVSGLEDAYVQFTDIGGSGVSVIAGQFQVSDPLFKRELRLEYEDYQPYRFRVGDARADLTYDRGFLAFFSPREGMDVALQVVNGVGLNEAGDSRQYDIDDPKSFAARVSQDAGPLRLGGFVYAGREEHGDIDNDILYFGPDATLALGTKAELNLQYLRRRDDNPFFTAAPPDDETTVDAAFAELLLFPSGPMGRTTVTALFNWVDADAPVFRIGGVGLPDDPSGGLLTEYQYGALGLHFLHRRNVRFIGEVGWDFSAERARFVTGVVTAF